MEENRKKILRAQYTQLVMICFALIFSVATYILIGYIVPTPSGADAQLQLPLWIMGAIAVLFLGFAPVIFRALMNAVPPNASVETRVARFKVATIVSFAVRETTATLGLVLTLLTGDFRWVAGLGVLTLLAMVVAIPRRSRLEDLSKEIPPIG